MCFIVARESRVLEARYAIKPTCRANNRDVALFTALLSINLIDEQQPIASISRSLSVCSLACPAKTRSGVL